MKATKIGVIAVIIIMALTVTTMAVQSDDASAADVDKYGQMYKLTYHAEIEGELISDKSFAVTGGNSITMYAIPDVDGYMFAGWEYEGVIYDVGSKFTMPESDVTLNAKWESAPMADAVVIPEDTTMIFMILGAIFAISAIIGAVVVMKMRAHALSTI